MARILVYEDYIHKKEVAIVTRTFQERPDKYNILQFEFDTDQSCLLSVIQDIENENMVICNDYTKNRKAEIICSI